MGLGMGGVAPVQSALLARAFGVANFGPVIGLCGPIMSDLDALLRSFVDQRRMVDNRGRPSLQGLGKCQPGPKC